MPEGTPNAPAAKSRWYDGVTGYQWLVLAVASAGWVFDNFESQIFNITRTQMLADIFHVSSSDAAVRFYGDVYLGVFLIGGTVGGILFGVLADRWGRRPAMIATILMYSIFSGLTYFAQTWWHVAALRFLVAMGTGGEWAVAAALVAEMFPRSARAYASAIFHASSVLGIWLAALAGLAVGASWRYAFLVGVLPALLVLWVRASVGESESWSRDAAKCSEKRGSLRELLTDRRWAGRAVLGLLLAAVGIGSYWGVVVAGQDLAKEMLVRTGASPEVAGERAKFAYGIVQQSGSFLGLIAFGPICMRIGRKRAFTVMLLAALAIVPATCYLPATYAQLLCMLPVFGFLTVGMHAGFAIYFPELFPTHLRGTGCGFCFNGARILAASMLWFSGWLKSLPGMDLRLAVTLLGLSFVLGLVILLFLPETKDQPLPE